MVYNTKAKPLPHQILALFLRIAWFDVDVEAAICKERALGSEGQACLMASAEAGTFLQGLCCRVWGAWGLGDPVRDTWASLGPREKTLGSHE